MRNVIRAGRVKRAAERRGGNASSDVAGMKKGSS